LERLNFEIEQSDIIDENPDSQFATAKVKAFSSGESRNDTYCSEESLMATAHTIENKPILYNVSNIFGDFSSHNPPESTLIAGFVEPGSISFERDDSNRLSLNVLVKLWKRYSPKAMEIFQRDGGKKKVSVEVDLIKSENRPDGLRDMIDFVYSGICILGDLISEGSPGANLEMMSFAEENKKYKEAVALEFGSYEGIDLTIPDSVKKNVAKGLELYKQYNKGATSVSLASARHIVKNDKITPEKLRHIAKTHKSNKFQNKIKSPPNESYIGFLLYGGQDGMSWANEINDKLDEQDKQQLSYFSLEDNLEKEKTNMEDIEKKEEMAVEPPKEEMAAPPVEEEKKEEMAEEPKKEEMATESETEKKEEEPPTEENREEEVEKKEMSNDQNLDVAAFLAMLENETDAYANLVKEEYAKEEKDFAKMFEAMCGKYCKMAEEKKDLLAYKEGIEKKQFEFEVQSTMKYIDEKSTMPQDKKDYLVEESKKFSLENIDGWKNLAKAEALDFAKKEDGEPEELRFDNPWIALHSNEKKSVWDALK
jgi:hypothetical protein